MAPASRLSNELPGKETALTVEGEAPSVKVGHYRWTICALLFFATTINYMDRQVLAILAPYLHERFGWNEAQYGYIVMAFQCAYGIGLPLVGRMMDAIGTRRGYAVSITIWSLATVAHAMVQSVLGFGVVRFVLGLGEAGNFPAAVKTIAEWFPKRERALATGVFNAGANVGAIAAPLLVPWLAARFGWQSTFIVTGLIGFIWLAFWLRMYRPPQDHPSVGAGELAYIQSDPPDPAQRIPWRTLITYRQTWAVACCNFLTSPIWWFYLFWAPKFLYQKFGLNLSTIGLPLVVIYLMADVGSVGGGWLSSSLIKRGWAVPRARRAGLLICALSVIPVMLAPQVKQVWLAVLLMGLATACHQGWAANMYTVVSDMFPRRAVASVVGFGGMMASIGGMLVAGLAGYILQLTGGNYQPMFIVAGLTYVIAFALLHLLAPGLKGPNLETETR